VSSESYRFRWNNAK